MVEGHSDDNNDTAILCCLYKNIYEPDNASLFLSCILNLLLHILYACITRCSLINGSSSIQSQGKCLPFGSIGMSLSYKSIHVCSLVYMYRIV